MDDFVKEKIGIWLVFRQLQTDFFQTWYDDTGHPALHFDFSLDDLYLHSRSKRNQKHQCPFFHSLLPQLVGLLKLLNYFAGVTCKGKNSADMIL